jgi:Mn-dependent DtxR family transcriptional regulator
MDTTIRTLTYICDFIERTNHAPTIRQLATELSCSPATAHHIITGLIDRQLLEHAGPTKALTLTENALITIGRI